MHYLIDGYNLLFRSLESGQSIQSQRQNLINALQTMTGTLHLSATVVFDSAYQEYEGSRSYIQTLEVAFTDQRQTADDYIVMEVRKYPNPRQLVVITSDNKLAWRCRQLGAKTETCEQFVRWTRERVKKKEKQLKEQRKETWTGLEEDASPPQEEAPPSPPQKSTGEAFDRYLKIFEAKDSKVRKNENKNIKRKNKTEKNHFSSERSETERWLDIFENRKEEDAENTVEENDNT